MTFKQDLNFVQPLYPRLSAEICSQVTWHSPPPTPLLPALTLSAGEYRVSGGELKVSRQVDGDAFNPIQWC